MKVVNIINEYEKQIKQMKIQKMKVKTDKQPTPANEKE